MTKFYRLTAQATLLALLAIVLPACAQQPEGEANQDQPIETQAASASTDMATAIFAGGCFWCMEAPFDQLDGVSQTISGYIGGRTEDPTYREVSSGSTGHTEAVEIVYDPQKVSYEKLLEVFWHNVDPTDAGGQFCDRGSQYRTGIFTTDEKQQKLAKASKAELQNEAGAPNPIVTKIEKAGTFYKAEDYHQNYYITTPVRYKFYRSACGRDARLETLWGENAGH